MGPNRVRLAPLEAHLNRHTVREAGLWPCIVRGLGGTSGREFEVQAPPLEPVSVHAACAAPVNVQSARRSKRLPGERRVLRFVPAVRLPAGADQPAGKRLKPGERGC